MDPVRDHLLGERRAWVERVLDCADAVADSWPDERVSDRERVVTPFRAALDRTGVLAAAPTVLDECVTAAGGQLRAQPVASPPYVVVTSEGLVLRATLDDGRLVVRVRAFEVGRDPVGYRRGAQPPEDAVVVERPQA
ncbi:hypothetical protein [Halorarius litoreus]|uniref:hypothetical protein n=1 Tax=Halorarius litoreus TaxID=2962676 RepID=UPI0020CE7018|nr:hypothetical protein [Halorarius litoreus]